MTTDTAVAVTRKVVEDRGWQLCMHDEAGPTNLSLRAVPLDKIPYVDNPELKINEHESIEMPFRYIRRENGEPVMPEVYCQQSPRSSNKD